MKYEVIFYEDEKGKCPVEDFLDSLDVKMRYKVVSYIDLLKDYGPNLRASYNEILTNDFVIKTQKTPRKEIDLAKKRRKDYLERKGDK